jgi:hypothetical protein
MRRLLTTTALLAVLALPVAAQEAPGGPLGGGWIAAPDEGDMRSSQLLGAKAYITRTGILEAGQVEVSGIPQDWEEVGTISDLLLADDAMPRAILAEIGADARTVAMPLDAVRILRDVEDGAVVVLVESSRQEIDEAPAFGQE